MKTHTSLELSKWLAERGFNERTEYIYSHWDFGIINYSKIAKFFITPYRIIDKTEADRLDEKTDIPAYDLLNDLCVTHGEELFKGNAEEKFTHMGMILHMLISNKKEEAEKYLMEKCILKKLC